MKKLKNFTLVSLSFVALSTVFVACDKDDDQEVVILSPYAGNYEAKESCILDGDTSVSDTYAVTVSNAANDANSLVISNIWDYAPPVKGSLSGNTVTIPEQQVVHLGTRPELNDTFRVSGTGTFNGDKMDFKFKSIYHGDTYECDFQGDRLVLKPAIGL